MKRSLPARQTGTANHEVVRDRLWAWAHEAGVYNGAYCLPGNSRITPVEGAYYLGVPNIILIRYGEKPAPPFEQYAVPFRSLKQVNWSLTGAGGATSIEERNHVFRLASAMPNVTGFFMDDFFLGEVSDNRQWLADIRSPFPVWLTIRLASPARLTRLELMQSDSAAGDYRSADFAIDLSDDGPDWYEAARGTLLNVAGARVPVEVAPRSVGQVRVRILGTHDTKDALSCGLRRIRLWSGEREVSLRDASADASSTCPGHCAQNVMWDAAAAPASLNTQQLRDIRSQLIIGGRRLDLGVTLYAHHLTPQLVPHLELCDVISLWTWRAENLKDLESNFAKLKAMAPSKRIRLGCYMWDFGDQKPMPVEQMERQCEIGLRWLKHGQIEGMIFLGTNICDLSLETVEWTRRWIAEVGGTPLRSQGRPDSAP